jgi:regulator of replication initiation timing
LNGYDGDTQGTYIHPELVNFVAEWEDKTYALKVSEIMNDLNKQLHYIMEDNDLPDEPVVAKRLLDSASVQLKVKDEEISDLKDQVEALTDENRDLKIDINVLGLKKKKLGIKLKRLERKQFDRDVRTNLCYRNVKILKDVTTHYFSADHQKRYRKLPVVHQFVFPSNMNVRREVKRWMENEFKREIEAVPSFSEAELPAVLDYVRSLKPKKIIHFINRSI